MFEEKHIKARISERISEPQNVEAGIWDSRWGQNITTY